LRRRVYQATAGRRARKVCLTETFFQISESRRAPNPAELRFLTGSQAITIPPRDAWLSGKAIAEDTVVISFVVALGFIVAWSVCYGAAVPIRSDSAF
jgi:hypothetical protein